MSFIQVISLTFTGRQDLAQLLSMGKRKIVSSPRTHVSKPYPRTEGSQSEEDGMEHLDQEVRTCVNIHSETYLIHMHWERNLWRNKQWHYTKCENHRMGLNGV